MKPQEGLILYFVHNQVYIVIFFINFLYSGIKEPGNKPKFKKKSRKIKNEKLRLNGILPFALNTYLSPYFLPKRSTDFKNKYRLF